MLVCVCSVHLLRFLTISYLDGSVYYSTQAVSALPQFCGPMLNKAQTSGSTYQTGADADVRTQFIQHGTLLNTQDTSYRAVNDRWPIFAHAHDLGTVGSSTSEAAVFSIGHVRDPAIQYIVANSVLQDRSLYFWSSYSSVLDAVCPLYVPYRGRN